MLSILIPTYHYNVYPLAENLVKRAKKSNITFELICIDDGSNSELNKTNEKINSLPNCKFIQRSINKGRTATRQELAEQAQYNWLLFLDADVIPKNDAFLTQYIGLTTELYKAVFGGFAYNKESYSSNKSLRYTFGKHREEISAQVRNKNPNKVIISSNFMIDRAVFIKINKLLLTHAYGMDYIFGAGLKANQIPVLHIDNEVFHLEIDTNYSYLKKTQIALQTLKANNKDDRLKHSEISLLNAYYKLKSLGLSSIFGWLLDIVNNPIEKHLTTSKSPSLFIFDLYRLGYFCRINSNS